MELTEAARKNLAAGATSGAGTAVCKRCGGPKEPTRVNSAACRDCGGPATESITVRIPRDVRNRLAAEAAEKGMTVPLYLTDLIVKRDKRRHDG